MTLREGQLWKKDDDYFRITRWARLSIEYKLMKDPSTKEGSLHQVTKKEFCRLIKGAVNVTGLPLSGSSGDGEALPGEPSLD